MKNLRGLFVFVFFLFALPGFAAFDAFLKIDGVRGESTNPSHMGWIDVASFSWGMATAPVTSANHPSTQACATNEIHFTVRGSAAPQLLKLVGGAHLQPVALEVGGQRHVLEGATVASCQNNLSPTGQQSANCVMKFQRCATHASTALNASMVSPNAQTAIAIGGVGGAADSTIIAVHPGGANTVQVTFRGGSQSLLKSCATGQHLKQAKLTCRKAGGDQHEYLTITLTDVLISSYQVNGDGSISVGMKYGASDRQLPAIY